MTFNNMETLDPLSIAREGTKSYVVALQVNQLAKKARELGLDDQADSMVKALYSSIKNKNSRGLDAAISLAEGVSANVNAIQTQAKEVNKVASGIDAVLGYAKESGYNVDPDLIASTSAMYNNKDLSGLQGMQKMIESDITRQAESRQKLGDAGAKGTLDPQAQVEANKMMANKLLRQFYNAQKILNDPEAPKAFTGLPTQQAYNRQLGIGNNVRSYMDSIGGFNLGRGMQEVKETTGTAAGMAASETEAFKAAQSALKIDQDWSDAAEQLNIFNASLIRTLKGLGVRNEYLNKEGAEKWLKGTDVNLPLLDTEKIGQGSTSQTAPPTTPSMQMVQGLPNPQMTTSQAGTQPVVFGAPSAPAGATAPQSQPQAQQQPTQAAPASPAQQPTNPYSQIRGNMSKQFNVSY